MTALPTMPHPLESVGESGAPTLSPAELAAKAQAKFVKKERKHARMRWFFSWCWGCRSMGGSF